MTDTLSVLVHVRYTTMRLPAVLALLKARLLSVPEVISVARTCLKVGVAAAALAGIVVRGSPRDREQPRPGLPALERTVAAGFVGGEWFAPCAEE